MINKFYLNIKKNFYYYCFSLIFVLFFKTFLISFNEILGDKWAYQELFINYSSGFIRRGLLGEIYLQFNKFYSIEPYKFFSIIYLIIYSLVVFFYLILLRKLKNFPLFYIFVIFSPGLLLFYIYDINTFLTKDIFTVLSILLHALYINRIKENFKIEKYNNFLSIILIPLLIINIINHEIQFFFIGIHLLLSIYLYRLKKVNIKKQKLFLYILTLAPIIIIFLNPGSWEKIDLINSSISNYDVKINNQLAGNINLAIGGFLKWHFIYHGIESFINLFVCLILTLFLYLCIFQFLYREKIILLEKKIYLLSYLFFLPSFLIFILAVDHGRSINLILTHLVVFLLIIELDSKKLETLYKNFFKNVFVRNLFFLFLFFNIFLWYLPQGGGYAGVGSFNGESSIIKNTLFTEFTEIFMIIFNYVDTNIIKLPRVII